MEYSNQNIFSLKAFIVKMFMLKVNRDVAGETSLHSGYYNSFS